MLGTTLSDEKVIGQRLDNWDKKLEIARKHFGNNISPRDFMKLMNASTPAEIDRAIKRLIRQGLKRVRVSREPFTGDMEATEQSLVDMKLISEPE
jgi:hypothetical protein